METLSLHMIDWIKSLHEFYVFYKFGYNAPRKRIWSLNSTKGMTNTSQRYKLVEFFETIENWTNSTISFKFQNTSKNSTKLQKVAKEKKTIVL